MADYSRLLDQQMQAFIERTASFYPDNAVEFSVAEQRATYAALCAGFHRPYPDDVSSKDATFAGVRCRVYHNSNGVAGARVMFFHGGGFVVGDLDTHDSVCGEICAASGLDLTAVDYRLAPEHQYPADVEDCWAVLRVLAEEDERPIILVGDSAGGTLSATLAHQARQHLPGRLAGQVLIYPALGGDIEQGSYLEHAEAPGLTRDDIAYYMHIRTGGVPGDPPVFAPLRDADFAGLPPTVIITADCDPLRDDGPQYAAKITEAGGQVVCINELGMIHGYLRARVMSDKAAASFERITQAVAALGQGQWIW